MDVSNLSTHYRKVRRAVYEQATMPASGSPDEHLENKAKFRQRVTDLCNRANLNCYCGSDANTASAIWHLLWTTNRYAGIRASIAAKEIEDIQSIFDRFEIFSSASWNVQSKGHKLVGEIGSDAKHFLDRTGEFHGKQTIGNLPKLQKIVNVARKFKAFLDEKTSETPVLKFVTTGNDSSDVWSIHSHLLSIGYTSDLTVLHFMMDLGFQVVKPDVVLTRLFLEWGWLHIAIPTLPQDVSPIDLVGKGKYGGRFKYNSPAIYRPVIDLARRIVNASSRQELISDIGWATDSPLREFDIFVVKFGQQPEAGYGVTRVLSKTNFGKNADTNRCRPIV